MPVAGKGFAEEVWEPTPQALVEVGGWPVELLASSISRFQGRVKPRMCYGRRCLRFARRQIEQRCTWASRAGAFAFRGGEVAVASACLLAEGSR